MIKETFFLVIQWPFHFLGFAQKMWTNNNQVTVFVCDMATLETKPWRHYRYKHVPPGNDERTMAFLWYEQTNNRIIQATTKGKQSRSRKVQLGNSILVDEIRSWFFLFFLNAIILLITSKETNQLTKRAYFGLRYEHPRARSDFAKFAFSRFIIRHSRSLQLRFSLVKSINHS